jgi:hypothetical protein
MKAGFGSGDSGFGKRGPRGCPCAPCKSVAFASLLVAAHTSFE